VGNKERHLSPFPIPHSPFSIPHSPFLISSTFNTVLYVGKTFIKRPPYPFPSPQSILTPASSFRFGVKSLLLLISRLLAQ
jgi:hypothetical protein